MEEIRTRRLIPFGAKRWLPVLGSVLSYRRVYGFIPFKPGARLDVVEPQDGTQYEDDSYCGDLENEQAMCAQSNNPLLPLPV